jgi:hypothetical protein
VRRLSAMIDRCELPAVLLSRTGRQCRCEVLKDMCWEIPRFQFAICAAKIPSRRCRLGVNHAVLSRMSVLPPIASRRATAKISRSEGSKM